MEMRKKGILVLAILVMGISIAGIGIITVMGHSGDMIYSAPAYTPPTIDGVIEVDEWNNANTLSYGDIGNVTVWVMNDADNLYVAATWDDLTPAGIDIIGFAFDPENDGNLIDGGEDGVVVICANDSGSGFDGHYNSTAWMNIRVDDIQNINAGTTYADGNWTVEWSKPLSSGDPRDMDVSAGDTIGIFSKIVDDFSAIEGGAGADEEILSIESIWVCAAVGAWPPGVNGNDANTYGDIVLSGLDLNVSDISLNCGYLFANESNNITATIENVGIEDASAFNVSFDIDGFNEEVRISGGLDAGENTTITVTDPTLRNAGEIVAINVTADCNGEITESKEANNVMNITKTVVNNGYKGKRYTGGEDINTWKTFEFNGSVLYSSGDSYYLSAWSYPNWTTYNASWTAGDASDLPVPGTATVKEARLYVPYTRDKAGVMPDNVSLTFNGFAQTLDKHYSDEKGWATSYPYGMLAYNVTTDFNETTGNVANLTNSYPGGGNVSMRGMLLVVIYADENEPPRQIFVNEEFDLLYGGSAQCTTPAEATAFAPFAGAIADIGNKSARLITVAPGAGPDEGELIFNGQVWNNVWNFTGATQIGIDERDVTEYLNETANEAGFQSSADYMEASNAILVVTTKVDTEAPVVTNPSATPDSIPDDTDNGDPAYIQWLETSQLNVTVTDESDIASVTINLSQIGGLEAAEMTNIEGTDIWSITTNASDGMTSPFEAGNYTPFQLYVNATDSLGNSNMSVYINLTVVKNGDVNEDGSKLLSDAMYLAKNMLNKPGYDTIHVGASDVTGDGAKLLSDAMYLAKNVLNKPGYSPLH